MNKPKRIKSGTHLHTILELSSLQMKCGMLYDRKGKKVGLTVFEKLEEAHALLKKVSRQLEAMNCSAAHACSWIEPRSNATKNMVKRIDRLLKSATHPTNS